MDSAVALLSSLFLSLPGLYLRTLKANGSILIFLHLSPCIFMTFKLRLVFCPPYLPSWACEPPINMTMLKNICAHYRTTQVIISFGYGSVLFDTHYGFKPIFSPSWLKFGCCGLLPLSFRVMLVPSHAHERGAALSGRNVWGFGLFQLNFPFQSTMITSQIVFPPGDPETPSQVMDAVQSKERGSSEITQPPAIPIGNIRMLYAFFFLIFFTADEMTFGKRKKRKDSHGARWLGTNSKDEKPDRSARGRKAGEKERRREPVVFSKSSTVNPRSSP